MTAGAGLWLMIISLAGAAIGDTKAVLASRFGPAKEAGIQNIYLSEGLTINVFFDKSQRSTMEVYSKRIEVDPAAVDETKEQLFARQPELTSDEIKDILKKNAGGSAWGDMRASDGQMYWYRGDRKVIAQYKKSDKALVVMSIE